jgi:phage pi2 protein 07
MRILSPSELTGTAATVYELLKDRPNLRDSDMELFWTYWHLIDMQAQVKSMLAITLPDFKLLTPPETIRRARQKIQEWYPELRGSNWVQRARKTKELTKGDFIFEQ